jgi:DNA-binding MarR family transcriptional regulator
MSEQGEETFNDQLGLPGLLRGARRAYGNAISAAFADAGFDDVPRNGAYVMARVWDDSSALAAITRGLGISKQAVSQLIDIMVMRGYLERTPDSEDRRRMLLHLTARGEAAAMVVGMAAGRVDQALLDRIGPDGVSALRTGLTVMCELADELEDGDSGHGHNGHDHSGHSHGAHEHRDD